MSPSFSCFDSHSFFDTGVAACYRNRGEAKKPWRVLLDLKHVAFGRAYSTLAADAVVDDFGDVVLMSNETGQVVLT